MLQKLRKVYSKFGEGKPVTKYKKGVSTYTKDDGIDVIAWKPRPGKMAGKPYLLGQVASGDNWEGKSVKGIIEAFHSAWFTTKPASTPEPAIFIPHAVKPLKPGERRERVEVLTQKYGTIFDRLYLPRMTDRGFRMGRRHKKLLIERLAESPKVRKWVHAQITALRGKSGVPL